MKNDRHCMSDRIRETLSERILLGQLLPGDRLVELDLAREFDTSQTPVREALRELESLRLVESQPYRGTRVRTISDQEMTEAYAVRGALEQLAGEVAAPLLQHDPASISELREISETLHRAAAASDIDAYCLHNMRFHRRIIAASHNAMLAHTWESLAFDTRVRIHLKIVKAADLVERAREHDAIVDALEQGAGHRAGKLLRKHANSCLQRWLARDRSIDASEAPNAELMQASVLS
jgi:DNA-binding GntR family transcriptional regulator